MTFKEGNIYHIYNRGNQQQRIFFSRDNYLFFLNKMRRYITPYAEFIAYCLMPNHFHWMVRARAKKEIEHIGEELHRTHKPLTDQKIDRTISSHFINKGNLNIAIGIVLRSYTRAIQIQESLTGSLFQQKTKAKEVFSFDNAAELSDHAMFHDDFFTCFNYIHQNPVKARLVNRLEEWEFSSFRDYAGLRDGTLCNQKLGF